MTSLTIKDFDTAMNLGATNKGAVSKMVKAWEAKNDQRVKRAAGLGLMAVSLAACGGEDDTPFSQDDVDAATAPLNTQISTLTTSLATRTSERDALQDAIDEATAAIEAAGADDLDSLIAERDELEDDLEVANADIETLTADLSTMTGLRDALQTALDTAETDLSDLLAELSAAGFTDLTDLINAYIALVTPVSDAYTTGVDALAGSAGNDVFTAADGTIGAGDALVDASSTDNDTLTITDVGTTLASMGTISNIENIIVNASSTGAYTITTAAGVTNSAITVNLTLAGGGTAVTVSDVGTQTAVIAGTRVANLTVDYLGTRGDMSVVGGTGALVVNGSDASVSGLTVDGSAGTTVAVDFGDDSSDISVVSGTGAVTIGSTAAAGDFAVAGLTVDASSVTGNAAIDVDYGTGSSDVSVTVGSTTGNVTVGAAGEAVAGLTVDASLHAGTGTITVLTATGSSDVNVTLGADAGALTATGAGVAGDISVTALRAIGAGVTQYETVTIAANSTTATTSAGAAYTSDVNVTAFTGSAASAAQYMDLALSTALEAITISGDQVVTVSVDADLFDTAAANTVPSITSSGADHIIALADAATVGLDLRSVANTILLEAAQTQSFELANNASIVLGVAQVAALFDGIASGQTLDVDMAGVNFAGAVQNVSTLNVTSSAAATLNVTVDANADGVDAGATIVLSGAGDVTVASTTAADSLNAASSSGDLTVTTSATIDTVTTGSGDDIVVAYAGDHTVVMGTGDDTYRIGVNISADDVSVSGHEIVTLTANATMTIAQANAILDGTTVGGAFVLTVSGTDGDDAFDISNAIEGAASLTSIDIDAGEGDDTIVLNDEFVYNLLYTSGADGTDTITGFVSTVDDFDTSFATTNGGNGFATSVAFTADTTASLALTAAGVGSSAATDGYVITVDSLSATTEAGVIAAISNGEITINAAGNDFMLLLTDGASSWLFEVSTSANNATLTALDDDIVHVATFTDSILVAADII